MIETREYGSSGPTVFVLHGGPAAAGTMAPVARALAPRFRAVEPMQRESGGEPLTVARHVDDLDELIAARAGEPPPALVGHSWGAMLALAYAAAHPRRVAALALVACGTFDRAARARLIEVRDARLTGDLRRRIERLARDIPDPDARLAALGDLVRAVYAYDPIDDDPEPARCDARAHQETWDDMLRQQDAGVYPAAFRNIEAPVLMLHGTYDPHPGAMIRDGLKPLIPHLEYHEWERCGHYPWQERGARDAFYARLTAWLARHLEIPRGRP